MMNYNEPITREHIDIEAYTNKFNYAEFVLTSPSPTKEDYKNLYNDPTTFCYSHFRIDGARAQLYPYQDMILCDMHRFKYFRAANQIGKSLCLDLKAARNLLIDHGHEHNEAIVSKSLPQSVFQMRRIKSLLNSMQTISWKEIKGGSDSMSVISVDIKDDQGRIKYSNLLICAPCTEGLLGYNLHELNLDEFEFWDVDLKHFFNQIAQPRTYTTKGNITIFSNPNGGDNFGADLEQQILLNGEHKWHVYIFNYLDKPGNTIEEYNELKNELSRQEFESTVAAIRSISDRNYLTPDEIEKSYDPNLQEISMIGKQPFFFLDIGAKHDQSSLHGGYIEPDEHNPKFIHLYMPIIHVYPVGYPLSRVAGVDDIDESDGWHHEKSVKEHLQEWSVDGINPVFGYDVTGNEGMKALFEAIGIFGIDIVFSGPGKSGMYVRYKYFLEKGLLHRIKHKQWEEQASTLVAIKGVRGYLLINSQTHTIKGGKSEDAKLKGIPDDTQDGTVGLIKLADNPDYIPSSLTVIPHG